MEADVAKDRRIQRRVLFGTVSNYLGQFVTLGTGFLLTPFVLRHLGATEYGLWLLVGSVVGYGALLDFGVLGAVIKYIPEYMARGEFEDARRLIATALRIYCVLGLFAVVASAVFAPFFPVVFQVPLAQQHTAVVLMLVMGVSLGVSLPATITIAVVRGLQRYHVANVVTIVGTLLSAGATVVVLRSGGGVVGMVALSIPVTIVMQIPVLWYIRRTAPGVRIGWSPASRSLVRRIVSYSSALFVIQIAGQVQTKTDEMVIGAFLPMSAVTPYGIARRLSEIPPLLTRQFLKVLFPLASELHAEDDHARLQALFIAGTRLTLTLFLPVACAMLVLARPFLTLWVGAEYAGYTHLVMILTAASLLYTFQWPAGAVLQGIARHRPMAAMAMGSAVVNLLLSVVLVRPFGSVGVAFGTLIPTAIECLCFSMPYAFRVLGLGLRTALVEMVVPAFTPVVPMVLTLYGLRVLFAPASLVALLAVGGAGALVYAIGYFMLGATETERRVCHAFAARLIQGVRQYVGFRS